MRGPLAGFGLALISWLGCAPSHRMVHDGNVYFEHCYGADFDARVRNDQREACWNAWLAFYTRHQPAHRVDYAMRRVEALEAGEPPLALPGIAQQATSAPPQSTDLSAAGLVTLHGPRAGAEVSTVLDPSAPKSGTIANGCLDTCNGYEGSCLAACPRSDGDPALCSQNCAHEKSICLHGCY